MKEQIYYCYTCFSQMNPVFNIYRDKLVCSICNSVNIKNISDNYKECVSEFDKINKKG